MGHDHKSWSKGDLGHSDPHVFYAAMMGIAEHIRIRKDFDIPYLAGTSRSGTTYYRDRHMPDSWTYQGRKVWVDGPLIIHEWTELVFEVKGGQLRDAYLSEMYQQTGDRKYALPVDQTLDYSPSHQMAQHLERIALCYQISEGKEVPGQQKDIIWDAWTAWCDGYIKRAGSEKLTKCPGDLYLQPYEQDGHDLKLLEQMHKAGAPRSVLLQSAKT